jgi:transcriptional regulator with XRE-family HTH domain
VTNETRGKAIKRRRLHHGIKSLREFSERSGVSREALTAAENDEASEATYERVEAWLDRFDEEVGEHDMSAATDVDVIEFRISGNFGVDVIVKGPASHMDEIESAVEKLVRAAQASERRDE